MRFLVAVGLLAACGGSAPPATGPSSQSQPTLVDPVPAPVEVAGCAQAVDHVLDEMTPGGAVQAMVDLYVVRCDEDGWSDDARACMATAMSSEQGQACFDDELTDDQRESLGEATLAAFGD